MEQEKLNVMMAEELDKLLEIMESTANTLRGMTLDPAIPKHAKDCFWPMIAKLEAAVAENV